ncbi:hypothetical protein CCP4SC76_1960006 [Gammaproteobacteria bacterium]
MSNPRIVVLDVTGHSEQTETGERILHGFWSTGVEESGGEYLNELKLWGV